jgi:hypothetical protein
MQEAGLIAAYAALLADRLSFDRPLSERVRQEVEDHLWAAVEADPGGDRREAERRCIANFGDAHAIAAQLAVAALARRIRRVGIAVILIIAGVFMAMKARVAWYALTQWTLSDDMKSVGGVVSLIDGYALLLSATAAISGCAYIISCGIPAAFHPAFRRQLRRFLILCMAATAALFVSVASDGVLTALRLRETELSPQFLIPLFSMAVEIACAGALAAYIRHVALRMARAAALLEQ